MEYCADWQVAKSLVVWQLLRSCPCFTKWFKFCSVRQENRLAYCRKAINHYQITYVAFKDLRLASHSAHSVVYNILWSILWYQIEAIHSTLLLSFVCVWVWSSCSTWLMTCCYPGWRRRRGGARKEFVLILIPDKSRKTNIKQYEVCYILTSPLAAANSIITSITSVLLDTKGNH